MPEEQHEEQSPEFSKVALGLVIAVVILGGVVYAGYQYSQKKGGKQTLPSGYPVAQQAGQIDCSKPRDAAVNIWDYYGKCDLFSVDASTKWNPEVNDEFGFEFSLPETAKVSRYKNGMGLEYKEFQPSWNLLYSVDLASSRSGEFKSLTGKNYVENYWRQYPGLTGLKSVETIVNGLGTEGWKAIYKIGNQDGNTEMFFELGKDSGNYIHFTKGILSQPVFDNIVGTFKVTKVETTPAKVSPAATE